MYFMLSAVEMIDWLKITLQSNQGLHDFYWACPYLALATALISYWSHVVGLLILHHRGI